MNTFCKASEQPKEFTFSAENNMTPDQCWLGYAIESYKYRKYTNEEIENHYNSLFLDRDEENLISDVLKVCTNKARIRKAQIYLKKYLENMKSNKLNKPIEFKFDNMNKLKLNNVNLTIKK